MNDVQGTKELYYRELRRQYRCYESRPIYEWSHKGLPAGYIAKIDDERVWYTNDLKCALFMADSRNSVGSYINKEPYGHLGVRLVCAVIELKFNEEDDDFYEMSVQEIIDAIEPDDEGQ